MLIDYHTHTPLCRHATGEPEEYVARAIERGLGEIGFSDHNPMPGGYDADWRMAESELPLYAEKIRRARAAFPRFSIKFGIEADYHEGAEAFVAATLKRHDFDYVIGSIHYLGDWGFDNPANIDGYLRRGVMEIWREYFAKVVRLAETGLYDILGHPDVVKKFGHRPEGPVDDLYRTAIAALKKAGMAVDVNTSGLRRPAKEIYPSRRFLEIAREMDVPVTLGSDAHEPGHVGEDFGDAVALLKSVGYSEIQRYTKRRREPVAI